MTIPVRIMVLDTWEEFSVTLPAETPVDQLKAEALRAAKVRGSAADYLVKFRGAELPESGTTLQSAGVVPNAGLIVLSRRRIPAK
ncbi:MAG: hypothetical protein FJ206_15130 [Gemmatimonadetes bacterium]|nr:hypothetical protein [Gemmatimonadota bacterium]